MRSARAAGEHEEAALLQGGCQSGGVSAEQERPSGPPLGPREDQIAQLGVGHEALRGIRQAGLMELSGEGDAERQVADLVGVGTFDETPHLGGGRYPPQNGLAERQGEVAAGEGNRLVREAVQYPGQIRQHQTEPSH